MIELALLGLAGYFVYTHYRTITVKDGVRRFTQRGHDKAMAHLHTATVIVAPGGTTVPGAAVFQVVKFDPSGITAEGTVNAALAGGAVVLATDAVLDLDQASGPTQVFLAVTGDAGTALATARPGSEWAVLAPVLS